jgi:hypothetical protein
VSNADCILNFRRLAFKTAFEKKWSSKALIELTIGCRVKRLRSERGMKRSEDEKYLVYLAGAILEFSNK